MMLRKFGFKKAEPKESEARVKLQKELFAYNECATHGFPSKPSTLAYDPKLNLLAVGTKNGKITVVGAPGVEFSAEHDDDVQVTKLFFLPEQGRLISLCSDNTLHLWEINIKDGESVLEEVKKYAMEASKLKTISTLCLTADSSQLLVGTEGGNIHILDVVPFTLSEQIIYQDVVMQNVPDDFKVNPGAVEDIAQHPTEPDKFLIGYHRGLVVLWDNKAFNAEQTYNATQENVYLQLESLSWYRDGTQFMTAHADGSYIVWATNDSTKPKEQANTPYGPFPCKSINKICWKNAKAEPFVIFSGGMPRASYGDRNTVSVVQGAKQVVYDFTSRVVDFVVLSTADTVDDPNKEFDDPQAVIVLAEEEMVAIDLQSENWPTFKQPYLCSLHSSAITCAHHAENIPDDLWAKITEAGEQQNAAVSPREWPVWGGKNDRSPATSKDLLLTGHEDGTVRFWDASDIAMKLMYKLQTSNIFGTDMGAGDQANADADEEWPPFRKVGTFDPYSDDPRLGIQKMALCPLSDTLLIGGTSGQVIVLQFERTEREIEVKSETVNIVSDRDNFVWKGHEALTVKSGNNKYPSGFQPTCVMQLHPPAACTALALHSEWQIMAAGTAHGFGVFDYSKKKEVCTKCTLNPHDMTGTSESAMSRRKSFKKSLRESFRRLRKRRSERRKKANEEAKKDSPKKSPSKSKSEEEKSGEAAAAAPADAAASGEAAAASGEAATAAAATEAAAPAVETAPTAVAESPSTPPSATTPTQEIVREVSRTIERSIEARSTDDSMASMVRYLYFADTFLIDAQSHTPTLWAGTNAGTIFVFQITMPANDKRDSEDVQCILGKEIHLKHRAPVISICIVDRNACPLPAALEVQHERAKAPDMTGSHQVVICSEEQFKIFSLPNLKPQNKYKLTAHEGSKVRRIGFINFRSRSDENYSENDLVVLTNQGDMQVFTVPHLRRQLKAEAIRKENVNGIVSCVFTHNGEGFFPESPSEFVRFSLSARTVTKPMCQVELAEGMRPEPVPEPEPVVEAEAETPAAADAEAAAGDGADGGEADESKAEADDSMVANESQMSQDLTMDSVKIHLSEASEQMSSLKSEVMQSSSSVVRTVVTRTVVQETTGNDGEPTRVVQSETTTTRVTSQDGEITGNEKSTVVETSEAGAAAANLDDDTKTHLTNGSAEANEGAVNGVAEQLEELKIREDGDEETAPPPATKVAVTSEDASSTPATNDTAAAQQVVDTA